MVTNLIIKQRNGPLINVQNELAAIIKRQFEFTLKMFTILILLILSVSSHGRDPGKIYNSFHSAKLDPVVTSSMKLFKLKNRFAYMDCNRSKQKCV